MNANAVPFAPEQVTDSVAASPRLASAALRLKASGRAAYEQAFMEAYNRLALLGANIDPYAYLFDQDRVIDASPFLSKRP